VVVLFCLGLMDLLRGFTHTYRVHHAALNLAQIDPHPDALVLMVAFGISNFLTGALFILIALTAKHIAAIVLLLIPAAYFFGGIGMIYSGVTLQSPFIGQYIMKIYLSISLVDCFVLLYLRSSRILSYPIRKVLER
jgi:hypothetical protein